MMTQFDAFLLFCHGARTPKWREPFDLVTRELRQSLAVTQPTLPVSLAFLEFMQPDFPSEVARLYAQGARRIKVMLLFLAAGGHTLRDVQALVQAAQLAHPGLEFWVSDTMLEEEGMRAATLHWLHQTIALPPDSQSR
jgi:sirohydrochlorin cobaltochelatase